MKNYWELSHNVWKSNCYISVGGNSVHNKCVCDIPWKRSVVVLEKTDKFFVKLGNIYVHCISCRSSFWAWHWQQRKKSQTLAKTESDNEIDKLTTTDGSNSNKKSKDYRHLLNCFYEQKAAWIYLQPFIITKVVSCQSLFDR